MANNQVRTPSDPRLTVIQHTSGFPFDEWSESLQDTDQLVSIRDQEQERAFQPMATPCTIIISILIMVCLEIEVFLVPHFCGSGKTCGATPYSIMMYTQSSMWLFFILLYFYWRYEHYKSRMRGYLDFYRRTRLLRKMPIIILSGITALLLTMTTYLSIDSGSKHHDKLLDEKLLTEIVITTEVAAVTLILIIYLVRTVQFNRAQSVPDIQEEEIFGPITTSRSLSTGIGFRDRFYVDDILEKQADMIRYLKHHNVHLSRKILQLTAQLEHSS